VVKGSWIFWWD